MWSGDQQLQQLQAKAGRGNACEIFKIHSPYFRQGQQRSVARVQSLDGMTRIKHQRPPARTGIATVQIEKDFRKEPAIEIVVGLRLNFQENQRGSGIVGGRNQQAIQTKGGLFDLFGAEPVASGIGDGDTGQFEGQGGQGVENPVKQIVGFHGAGGSDQSLA